ncbi:5472_t:CDS:2 [Paraglomus brasilianum]|uniref:5472_t:CDS:1 n=1 Tax=Paraglomus brasilianum TaxID=144538 RepID=A0A9N9EXS6_9GLOM|nr:5472_t:CDS:2 [Paraglomus brasilianum]
MSHQVRVANKQETRSPHPVKLSVVDEEENKVVDDLRDFVALNLLKLVSKEVEGEIRPG